LGPVVVVVVVGVLLDGRVRGPGDRALAEDVARGMASGGIQTHLIELVPSPGRSPRLLHSVRLPHTWLRRAAPSRPAAAAAVLDAEVADATLDKLAERVAQLVDHEGIGHLHAIGCSLAGRVARLVQRRTGTHFCVTPRGRDLRTKDDTVRSRVRDVLHAARHVVLFDESWLHAMEAAFPARAGESPLRLRVLRRGVDLELFKLVPRQERGSAAARLGTDSPLGARLQGIEWERACVMLCVRYGGDAEGFAQFLFAIPDLLRQQPHLQVIVVQAGESPVAVDRLRAAFAAGQPDLLAGVLQDSELYQPLLDHLGRLHDQGRSRAWWETAARLEPERRVRDAGEVSREDFARLLPLADLVVLPGLNLRCTSQLPYEALAAGVLTVARAHAGMETYARLIREEISGEIAALCTLRDDAPTVWELEDTLGRFARLRPELGDRLRALAVRKFDARQTALDLLRLHAEPAARAAVARA
jgi:glycosyltransferase involved in cell wall biosynthesis